MKIEEIRRAKVGDRVKYEPRNADEGEYCEGTVTGVGDLWVEISWDDGVDRTSYRMNFPRVFLK